MSVKGYKIQESIKGAGPDSVSRGWRRLVRARDHAYAHDPATNQHAKLYFDRINLADNFQFETVRLVEHFRWGGVVDFYTCSDFCAVVQKQIGYAYTDTVERAEAHLAILGTKSPRTLSRAVTCHVCRRVVKKDGTVDNTHRIDFRNPKQIMTDVPKRTIVPFGQKTPKEQAATIARWGLPVEETMRTWNLTPPAPVPPSDVTISAEEYKELQDLRALRDAMKNVLDN